MCRVASLMTHDCSTVCYSTGVDDSLLTSNSILFTKADFLAFPIPADINYGSQELIGISTNWGGIPQNNSSTDYVYNFNPVVPSSFVRDGASGLELATNFCNRMFLDK